MAPAWSGATATGVTWIERLKRLGTPVVAEVGEMPYSAMLGQFDPYVIDRRHYELRTRTVRSLSEDVIQTLLRAGESRTSALSGIAIHHFHGACDTSPARRHRVRHTLGSLRRRDRGGVGPHPTTSPVTADWADTSIPNSAHTALTAATQTSSDPDRLPKPTPRTDPTRAACWRSNAATTRETCSLRRRCRHRPSRDTVRVRRLRRQACPRCRASSRPLGVLPRMLAVERLRPAPRA